MGQVVDKGSMAGWRASFKGWLSRRRAGLESWLSKSVPGNYLIGLFVVYVVLFLAFGFYAGYYAVPQKQPVPYVTVANGTDISIITEVPSTVTVLPLKEESVWNITIYVIPLRSLDNITVVLGSNLSRLYSSSEFKEVSPGPISSKWIAQVAITDSGAVETINDTIRVVVAYHYSETPIGPNSTATQSVDLPIKIVMSDFPNYFYLFMLSLGVIFSRVTPLVPGAPGKTARESAGTSSTDTGGSTGGSGAGTGGSTGARVTNAGQSKPSPLWELVWIPFSVVISLLIFSAFRQQVTLTTDLVENFALAFGFGYAFEKALSSAPATKS
jgi:hypothetical protein